eukprot:5227110-Pyramimonas_sp.AAC.1
MTCHTTIRRIIRIVHPYTRHALLFEAGIRPPGLSARVADRPLLNPSPPACSIFLSSGGVSTTPKIWPNMRTVQRGAPCGGVASLRR